MTEASANQRSVRPRYVLFLLLALLINGIDSALTRSAVGARNQFILAVASCFDTVVVVAVLFYCLLVRPGMRTASSLVTVVLLASMRASFLFPGRDARMIAYALCDAGLLGIVMIYVQRARSNSRDLGEDPVAAIQASVRSLFPVPVAANALSAELAVLYYAFFSWRAKPHIPHDSQAVSNYQKAGQVDLLSMLPVLGLLEVVPVHLLLHRWNATAAWVVTGLTGYGLIWLIGVARSFRLRPTLVAQNYLYLRYGLIFQLRVPRESIACLRRATPTDAPFSVPRKSQPTHCIEFVREVTAEGLFGFRKRLTKVAFTLDDPVGFERLLEG